ncbi:MAG: hypothetical protein COB37_02975 [Kordiimonadales bacterium]|nr:MAG: hypothetical protein COB37_02975 [Kordiimonadales bacterium]
MSHQEKTAAVSLISALIVLIFYNNYSLGIHAEGLLDGPDAAHLVGRSAFIMIGVGIGVTIILNIVFTIVHSVVTQEYDAEDAITNERDELIELKAMRISFISFCFAFMGILGVLAFGELGPYLTILCVIGVLYLSSILGDVIKLYHYRRGF